MVAVILPHRNAEEEFMAILQIFQVFFNLQIFMTQGLAGLHTQRVSNLYILEIACICARTSTVKRCSVFFAE